MLRVANVSAGYGGFQALFDVSLDVNAGESVAVIGPNGAGKTTLLRLISKLIEPSRGEVSFEGKTLSDVPAHAVVARGIAQVPENRRLFPRLTAEENLRMGAFTARGKYAERLEQVYALFPKLKERRRQRAGTFSGGEQQMLAIGRGLMSDPKLLIIDELSQGLAPVMIQLVVSKLEALKQTGLTILLVEQNVHLALALSHYAYVIAEGRPFADGPSAQIAAMPEIRQAYLGL